MNVLCLCILLAKYSNEFKWSKRIKKNCCSRMPSCLCSSARVCGWDSQWLAPSYSCTWPLGTWWQSCKCLCYKPTGDAVVPDGRFFDSFGIFLQWFLMVSDGFWWFPDGFCWFLLVSAGFWWLFGRMISKTVLRELVFYSTRCTDCCTPKVLLAVHHYYLLTETTCAMASWKSPWMLHGSLGVPKNNQKQSPWLLHHVTSVAWLFHGCSMVPLFCIASAWIRHCREWQHTSLRVWRAFHPEGDLEMWNDVNGPDTI